MLNFFRLAHFYLGGHETIPYKVLEEGSLLGKRPRAHDLQPLGQPLMKIKMIFFEANRKMLLVLVNFQKKQ